MRTILFALLFCMGPLLYSQNSTPMPFYQPFDSYDYANNYGYHLLEVNVPPYVHLLDTVCHSPIEDIIAAKGTTWDLYNRTTEPDRGKAMKLIVGDDDLVCIGESTLDRRRSEMLFILPEMEGNTSYIQWDLLIPISEFPDQIIDSSYQKIFQIGVREHDPNGIAYTSSVPDYPLVAIDYQHEIPPTWGEQDHKRDLLFRVRSPINDTIHYRVYVEDAIKKGDWTNIIYKTKWSDDDTQENVEFYIDGFPVVLKDPNYVGYFPDCIVATNTNATPYRVKSATISLQTSQSDPNPGNGKANNIKFGHYRKNHTGSHSIYVDDLKVIDSDPSDDPSPIKLESAYCNVSIPIDNQNITCEAVHLPDIVTNYKFRFQENDTTYYWVNNGPNRTVNLLDHDFLKPKTSYDVQVRAQGADFDIIYGDICSITMPHHTKLRSIDCDNLASSQYNGTIGALTVNNTTKYFFRFRDSITGINYYKGVESHLITPSSVSGVVEGRTYEVHVRALEPEEFNYGDGCYIRFPSTSKSLKTEEPAIIPNPFTESIQLNGFSNIEFIKIIDLSGNVVYSQKRLEGNILDLQFLKKGFYFVEITSANTPQVFKLIKE